jgi:hypothetical protein
MQIFPFGKRRWGNVLGLTLLAAGWMGQAQVVTFDPASLPRGSRMIWDYAEQGMRLEVPTGFAHTDKGISANLPQNSSAYVQFGATSRPLTISHYAGQPFTLLSVDLAEYSTVANSSRSITFFGTRANGETVQQTFQLDGVIDGSGGLQDFQTFAFGPDFTNVVSVMVTNVAYALDNLAVAIATNSAASNLPPFVTLNLNQGWLRYAAPVVSFDAQARDFDGQVVRVDFYANSNLIGAGIPVNLSDWKPLTTQQLTDGLLELVDPTAGNFRQSFYRVVSQ